MFRRGSLLRSMASGGAGGLLRSTASGGAGALLRSTASGGVAPLLRSTASGGAGPHSVARGGAAPLLRSTTSGGAGLHSMARGGAAPLLRSTASGGAGPHSVASGGGGPLLLLRSMASGASASWEGGRPGHKAALLPTVFVVTALTLLLNERASASSDVPPELYFGGFEEEREEEKEEELPAYVDWENDGAVNVPKDQGDCGSCWAHAGVGAIEALHFIKHGELLSLSIQSVIDCSMRGYNRKLFITKNLPFITMRYQPCFGWGCRGGNAIYAFEYAQFIGLPTEEDYPLRSRLVGHWFCAAAGKPIRVKVKGWANVGDYGEKALMSAVAKQPVVVTMDGFPEGFDYKGGRLGAIKLP